MQRMFRKKPNSNSPKQQLKNDVNNLIHAIITFCELNNISSRESHIFIAKVKDLYQDVKNISEKDIENNEQFKELQETYELYKDQYVKSSFSFHRYEDVIEFKETVSPVLEEVKEKTEQLLNNISNLKKEIEEHDLILGQLHDKVEDLYISFEKFRNDLPEPSSNVYYLDSLNQASENPFQLAARFALAEDKYKKYAKKVDAINESMFVNRQTEIGSQEEQNEKKNKPTIKNYTNLKNFKLELLFLNRQAENDDSLNDTHRSRVTMG